MSDGYFQMSEVHVRRLADYSPVATPADAPSRHALWALSNTVLSVGLGLCVAGLIGTLRLSRPNEASLTLGGGTRTLCRCRSHERYMTR
jgi:hypothetical protein